MSNDLFHYILKQICSNSKHKNFPGIEFSDIFNSSTSKLIHETITTKCEPVNDVDEQLRDTFFIKRGTCDFIDVICEVLLCDTFITYIYETLGVDTNNCRLTVTLNIDSPGYCLKPHTDSLTTKLIGCINCPVSKVDMKYENYYGTKFYKYTGNEYGHDMSSKAHNLDTSDFEIIHNVKYAPGTGYLLRPPSRVTSHQGLHGVENNIETSRSVILIDFISQTSTEYSEDFIWS